MGPISNDGSQKRFFSIAPPAALIFFVLIFVAGAIVTLGHKENLSILQLQPKEMISTEAIRPPTSESRVEPTEEPNICDNRCRPSGSEALPRGIVQDKSNFEMESLGGNPERKKDGRPSKSLLAIPVGIKQKAVVDKLVSKFPAAKFTVMLFHYDGVVDRWGDLKWFDRAIHVAARDQTKWWFAKRFLHPDLVAEYEYIFLWDEDIEVDSFDPLKYLRIVRREGLEISQPALDHRSQIHHRLTARARKGDVHRRFYKTNGRGRCYGNSTGPPCTGWVEMMVPVFSRAAWRCAWHMIQNDLIYAWGLDFKLGYCAQGDRRRNVGVVDSQYVLHRGIPTLGDGGKAPARSTSTSTSATVDRYAVRRRSYDELQVFNRRWREAVEEDGSWTDPYPKPTTNS
ncbi:uncharacterized protein LOC133909470 isoform X2 [Phragmites australis]|uniref:uncharacterized protein LOC133909470 isoform X2 n=1 Tax=Phragmites australis TaxID=29695 RepID=UPI002D7704CF|nr:uncharacterized protein LOC133909470 isoform X2 [Phragmites australis]